MTEADYERILRCLDSALRIFRDSPGRHSVAEIKIESLLSVVRKTVAHHTPAMKAGNMQLRSDQGGRDYLGR